MADIELNVLGDASGAAAALGEVATATGELGDAQEGMSKQTDKATKSAEQQAKEMDNLKAGLLAVGALAVKFGAESVKAYAEAEKVQRQLALVAGNLTSAFEAQADALEAQLAVDGEVIKQQQTLLLQWGAAPSAIEGTIRAVEDYAAATGKDAVEATRELIRGVETGGAAFKKLGVEYEATGNKSEDLRRLTEALQKQFGGAAATDAGGLTGGLRAAEIAFGNLQESFGGMIGTIESKLGVLQQVTTLLRGFTRQINDEGIIGAGKVALDLVGGGAIGKAIGNAMFGAEAAPEAPAITDSTPRGIGGGKTARQLQREDGQKNHNDEMWKLQKKNADDLRKLMKEEEEFEMEQDAKYEKEWDKAVEQLWKEAEEEEKVRTKRLADNKKFRDEWGKVRADEEKKTAEYLEKKHEKELEAEKKKNEALEKLHEEEAKKAKEAGDQIGSAFVNALADQLSKLAEGEEFDPALFVGEILAAMVATAGAVIGSAYGMPALGAAIGNLAGMGIRAGASGISKKGKSKKYHDGGWVEPIDIPRHHSGAWIGAEEQMAVLQTGERVLSRAEVTGAGGPAAVDAMASGGNRGGLTVNVSALDAKSAFEAFSAGVGAGLKRSVQIGRGDMPAFLAPVGGAR